MPLHCGNHSDEAHWSWRTITGTAITEKLSPSLLPPPSEILVLGTGDRVERLEPRILEFMKKKRIAVEVQDTANACATFNFLTSERRITAAGLIPPPSAGQ
ncbi:UNVERIFIED_CONTAM: hypothetical protein FKN15_027731 [Acipenser sinensis]